MERWITVSLHDPNGHRKDLVTIHAESSKPGDWAMTILPKAKDAELKDAMVVLQNAAAQWLDEERHSPHKLDQARKRSETQRGKTKL